MDPFRLQAHRRRNMLQSCTILGAMALLLAWLGWIVAGWDGIVLTLLVGLFLIVTDANVSLAALQRVFGARRLSPAQAPGLFRLLEELSARAGLERPPALFYIPSPAAQAMAVGQGANAALAITDGLIRILSTRELAAVLAHEVSHVRHGDIWIMGLAQSALRLTHLLSTFGLFLVALYVPLALFGAFNLPLVLIAILVLAPTVSALLGLWLSRTRELDADAGAAALTGDPHGLALALAKLERLQGGMWEGVPQRAPAWLRWLRTHPEIAERIARLEELTRRPAQRVLALPEEGLAPPVAFTARAPQAWPRRRRYV